VPAAPLAHLLQGYNAVTCITWNTDLRLHDLIGQGKKRKRGEQ